MNQLIEERIEIIDSYESHINWKEKTLEQRIKWLKLWGYLRYIFGNLLLFFVIVDSGCAIFHLASFYEKWHRSALMVLMGFSFALSSHILVIELLLCMHLKKISVSNFEFNGKLNFELESLNKSMYKPYWIIIPAYAIALTCFAIVMMNQGTVITSELRIYWEMLPLPVFISTALLFWNMNYKVFRVRRNIKNVESGMNVN